MNPIEEIISAFEDMCGESDTEIGNNAREVLKDIYDAIACHKAGHTLALGKYLDKIAKVLGK